MARKPHNSTLADKAYETLRRNILKGVYVPEQRLVERSLTEALGASRTPVRQALHRLEAELFLERLPRGGGYLVRKLERSDIMALFRVRIELEELAIRWAMPNVTPEAIGELERLSGSMEEFWKQGQADKVTDVNSRFHRAICQMSRNHILVELIDSLKNRIHRVIAKGLDADGAFSATVEEHAAIVDAMRNRQAEQAGCLLRKHLTRSMETVLGQV